MAGNPFRRAASDRPRDEAQQEHSTPVTPKSSSAKKKKVKIQTPPRSPEDPPRRLSEGRISPPPPPQIPEHDDDTDSTATADSELEEAMRNTRRNSGSLPPPAILPASSAKAPYNPFARTLATEEAAYGRGLTLDDDAKGQNEEVQQRTKPAMNVEEFKNILLSGSATPSPPAPSSLHPSQENSSGTDTSSASRHSLFDPAYDIQTPRSSIDQMDNLESASSDDDDDDDNDDEHSNLMNGANRLDDLAPPAPPKHPHKKTTTAKGPQTVSFANFDDSFPSPTSIPTPSTKVAGDQLKASLLQRAPKDLNKPLPEPPAKAPHRSESTSRGLHVDENNNDNVSPSEDLGQLKKAPPPPPASRRARSGSNPSREAKADAETASITSPENVVKAGPGAGAGAPPPPPSRKARSSLQPAANTVEPQTAEPSTGVSPSSVAKTMPPPPPPRNSSKPSLVRSPSSASRSSMQRSETSTTTPSAPPAPPPRRTGANSNRASTDMSRPPSLRDYRRSSTQSVDTERSVSLPNLTQVAESEPEANAATTAAPMSRDILADMSAFQAEIDALRAKNENG